VTRATGGAPPSGQLALGVGFNAARRLDNFVTGANAAVVEALRAVATGGGNGHVYLRGADATGKTHLLQACCAEAQDRGARVAYLSLANRSALPRGLLAGMAGARLVCIDDVDRIAGDAQWENAVFNLYNEAEASGSRALKRRFAGSAVTPRGVPCPGAHAG
jgi:DnaA family protein